MLTKLFFATEMKTLPLEITASYCRTAFIGWHENLTFRAFCHLFITCLLVHSNELNDHKKWMYQLKQSDLIIP